MHRQKRWLIAGTVAALSTTAGIAQDARTLLQTIQYETGTCAAYYGTIAAYASGDPEAGDLTNQYHRAGLDMVGFAREVTAALGARPEAADAIMRMRANEMKNIMANNVNNLPILFGKYADKCKTLGENLELRLKQLIDEERNRQRR